MEDKIGKKTRKMTKKSKTAPKFMVQINQQTSSHIVAVSMRFKRYKQKVSW